MSFGIPAALLFGLILIIASLGLFLTSKFKPDLHQESDNIYAVIGIVCGLLLLISLDLGAAMAFQQLLMIGALISLMWQFLQIRAENKRLKGGGRVPPASREREVVSARRPYSARLDDEPEYPMTASRGARRFDGERSERQFQPGGYEEDYGMPERRTGRMLPQYNQTASVERGGNQRSDYGGFEDRSYGEFNNSVPREDDWSSPPLRQESDWERSERPRRRNESARDTALRGRDRRRSSLEDSADEPAAKSTAYVDYEPIDNPEEPLEFPSQY